MSEKHDDYRDIPSQQTISEAGELIIYDIEGKEVPLKTLYEGNLQTLIVFIRHFFCGACELYVQTLCERIPQIPRPDKTISIIGCGGHALVSDYRTRNSIPTNVALYADPERKVYAKLGMRSTNSPFTEGRAGKEHEYHQGKSFWNVVFSSMWNGIASGPKALKGGPPGQNGGAVVMRQGECVFVHRMRNTTDYADLEELQGILKQGEKK